MQTSFKVFLLGALVVLISVSALGIGVAYRLDDHSREIKLLQNARIGEGHATSKSRSTQSNGGDQSALPGQSQRLPDTSSEDVLSVGFSLMSDKDPAVRTRCADTLGRVAAAENRGSVEYGPREAQMIDLMVAAYHSEKDERVRSRIISNAHAFNHPQADMLIALGLEDAATTVREAANAAKQSRDKRLVLGGSGEIQPRVWR